MEVEVKVLSVIAAEQLPISMVFFHRSGQKITGPADLYCLNIDSEAVLSILAAKGAGDNIPTPRSKVYATLSNCIDALGGHVQKVVVSDCQGDAFQALIFIERGNEVIKIDSSPDEAIVLAVLATRPIYIEESVLEKMKQGLQSEHKTERMSDAQALEFLRNIDTNKIPKGLS